jgi:hypothetical protein
MIIQTVFKAQENADYVDDWLYHHSSIGVTSFYLYDNSESNELWYGGKYHDSNIVPDSNFYGHKYRYTIEEARKKCENVFKDYNVFVIPWSPKNENGIVTYSQTEALKDFVVNQHYKNNLKTNLCAFIDMDEFIIKREDFKESRMLQKRFQSREDYKRVFDCKKTIGFPDRKLWLVEEYATKCIIDIPKRYSYFFDEKFTTGPHFQDLKELQLSESYYNHYNYSRNEHEDKLKMLANRYIKKHPEYEQNFDIVEDPGIIYKKV